MKMTIKKSRSLESVNRLDVGAKTKYHILLGNLFTLNPYSNLLEELYVRSCFAEKNPISFSIGVLWNGSVL